MTARNWLVQEATWHGHSPHTAPWFATLECPYTLTFIGLILGGTYLIKTEKNHSFIVETAKQSNTISETKKAFFDQPYSVLTQSNKTTGK